MLAGLDVGSLIGTSVGTVVELAVVGEGDVVI